MTPIIGFDSDLWYHLSHGRQLVESGTIPSGTEFSFLAPDRQRINYYWLFQALVFGIYEQSGYVGLVVSRAMIVAATLGILAMVLLHRLREPPALARAVALLALVQLVVATRDLLLRPHAFSYLFVAWAIWVLECRRQLLWTLPPTVVLWVNFHGIEYPVWLALVGAYGLEQLLRPVAASGSKWRDLMWFGLGGAAVLATPFGFRLLPIPFRSTDFVSEYISELIPRRWPDVLRFELSLDGLAAESAVALLLVLAATAALVSVARRRLRISHLLLALVGLVLLFRAQRFQVEAAMLWLPLLRSVPTSVVEGSSRERPAASWRLPWPTWLAVSLVAWASMFTVMPTKAGSYPLSRSKLNWGNVEFLREVGVGGRVMHGVDQGGYLLWALGPHGYSIAADLEVPFLFTDLDLFHVRAFYRDVTVLHETLQKLQPDFVIVPYPLTLASKELPAITGVGGRPRYEPVFFDDDGVLWADGERHPELVSRYRLEVTDPLALDAGNVPTSGRRRAAVMRDELERVLAIAPYVDLARLAAAVLESRRGEFARALEHASVALETSPSLPEAHLQAATALTGLGRFEEAIVRYRDARALSEHQEGEEETARAAGRGLAMALDRTGRPSAAYEALRRAEGLGRPESSVEDLFNLGMLARADGEEQVAVTLLRMARMKVPTEDDDWRRRIDAALAELKASDSSF